MKYIPADKLIAEIERRIEETKSMRPAFDQFWAGQISAFKGAIKIATSLQQEQPDFDDVDPKHLVHSHYTKVRETKTGRVFWAEYSREAAEWYEAGTGKAYSISDVEIVKEQPEVDLEKALDEYYKNADFGPSEAIEYTIHKDIARHFYKLGFNARKK